jgi:Kef-type K+ transport system membrane component KefB
MRLNDINFVKKYILTFLEHHFFVKLLLLLALSRLMGEIFERLKQPAMIGEILAGIILGPTMFGLIQYDAKLQVFSDMAVFLLVIIAGLEINPEEVIKAMKGRNIWIALMGFIIPISSGLTVGCFFNLDTMVGIFISLCISITALPVSIRILMDLKKLNTPIGQKIITAAIFNDVVALMILGILLDIKNINYNYLELSKSIGLTTAKVLIFIIIVITAYKLFDRAAKKVDFIKNQIDKIVAVLKGKETFFTILFIFILLFASISELVGLHMVVGAFFGAMLLSKEVLGIDNFKNFEKTTNSITMGLLAPIFFAAIGLEFNFGKIDNYNLMISVILISFISKIFGGYLGGKIAGLNNLEATTVGIGLNARGIMELVIANIALTTGIIDTSVFSILVIMGIFTTLTTPLMLKYTFDILDNKRHHKIG